MIKEPTVSKKYAFERGIIPIIGSSSPGVYIITYLDPKTDEKFVAYVGESSSLSTRISGHRSGFNKEGACYGPTGKIHKTSTVAGYMFNYDPNVNNWAIQIITTDTKQDACDLETKMYKKYQPRFNSKSRLANHNSSNETKTVKMNKTKTVSTGNIVKYLVDLGDYARADQAAAIGLGVSTFNSNRTVQSVSTKVNARSAELSAQRRGKNMKMLQSVAFPYSNYNGVAPLQRINDILNSKSPLGLSKSRLSELTKTHRIFQQQVSENRFSFFAEIKG